MRRKLCIAHSKKGLLLLVNAEYPVCLSSQLTQICRSRNKFLAVGRVEVPELKVEKVLQLQGRILAVLYWVRRKEKSLM